MNNLVAKSISCVDCKHSVNVNNQDVGGQQLVCRRYPPVPQLIMQPKMNPLTQQPEMEQFVQTVVPSVSESFYCGEFSSKIDISHEG